MRFSNETLNKALGKGIKFPKIFNKGRGRTNIQEGLDKINQSLEDILSTRVGERVMLPEYGSELHKAVFEPNDFIFEDLIRIYITEAIDKWEDRVEIEDISLISDDTMIDNNRAVIRISYRIRSSNIRNSFIYYMNRMEEGG